jgi:mRNA-degrading endonuclease RelE of RelBE toxin-antitoxin system
MHRIVKHFASPHFWKLYYSLPEEIKELANKNFQLLKENPNHPSLKLKKIDNFWSARIGIKYRTLAIETELGLVWFWIGTHAEYDKILRQ